ncbi:MAG: hypothetical protein LN413_00210 [Candidatus Thermoplasmatota archaeon]|nr:hypothetical protein [Candidatus Thermoplasmatota archaeon]
MSEFFFTYDLSGATIERRGRLNADLEDLGAKKQKPSTTWRILRDASARAVHDEIWKYLEEGDELLVIEAKDSASRQSRLPLLPT